MEATCAICKAAIVNSPCEVQYAHGGTRETWCITCWSRHVAERRTTRKAQLDAMPRCEVPGCRKRGSLRIGNAPIALVCGWHNSKIRRKVQTQSVPGYLDNASWTGKDLLPLA